MSVVFFLPTVHPTLCPNTTIHYTNVQNNALIGLAIGLGISKAYSCGWTIGAGLSDSDVQRSAWLRTTHKLQHVIVLFIYTLYTTQYIFASELILLTERRLSFTAGYILIHLRSLPGGPDYSSSQTLLICVSSFLSFSLLVHLPSYVNASG